MATLDGKAEMLIIYSALNKESEKCGVVKIFNEFESDGENIMIEYKGGVISKWKRDNPKIIVILYKNHRLSVAICPFF